MTYQLQFRPDALHAYRALRADRAGELGKRVEAALGRLLENPRAVRGECSRWDSLAGRVWALSLDAPNDVTWLILWAERPPAVIEVFYVGLAPGETRPDVAWTSER